MIKKLEEKGLEIMYASCDDYKFPTKLQGKQPDVVGWESDKQLLHVGLIVDPMTFETAHSQEKISVLSTLKMASGDSEGKHIPFYLGVRDADKINSKNFKDDLFSKKNIKHIKL